jgi:hypothetical protein
LHNSLLYRLTDAWSPGQSRAISSNAALRNATRIPALVEVVRDTPGVRQFQIALESESSEEKFSRDVLAIEVCAQPGQVYDDLKRQLNARLKDYLEVSPDKIVFTEDEADLERRLFAKNHIKAEYLVERRTGK